MFDKFIREYGNLSDALIVNFFFKSNIEKKESKGDVEIVLRCMNVLNGYSFEDVKIIFESIVEFRFVGREKTSSIVIDTVLILKSENQITFDFFPTFFNSEVRENPNSNLIIKCKSITYQKM